MESRGQSFAQVLKVSLLGILIISSLYAINQIKFSQYFPITSVQIYGVNRLDREEIQSILLPLVNHGFFSVNVEHIHERLAQIPWVSNTFVRRNWPDQITITVLERVPIAKWNDQGLLSDAGELFSPNQKSYPERLAKFIGPDGQHIYMLQYFYEMNRLLKPLHARIASLELTPYSTWKVMLSNGITLQMGHKDVLTRLSHFVKVYPKIVGDREADVEYVDLRYSNGVAIRWKNNYGKEAK
jgi:cell division protein FtsQ